MLKSDWNATSFFERLCASNKLAQNEQFVFCRCSGLDGFEEAIAAMQSATAICAVSDIADGYTELNNTPRTRRVKTIFLAMRHAAENMGARNECMETMRELFRQFMSRLMLEKVKIEQDCIYIDPRITFNEIDRYFFSGAACAYFQIAVDVFTDLRHNEDEWTDDYDEDQYKYTWYYDVWLLAKPTNHSILQLVKFCHDSEYSCIQGNVNDIINQLEIASFPLMLLSNCPEYEAEAFVEGFNSYYGQPEIIVSANHGQSPV